MVARLFDSVVRSVATPPSTLALSCACRLCEVGTDVGSSLAREVRGGVGRGVGWCGAWAWGGWGSAVGRLMERRRGRSKARAVCGWRRWRWGDTGWLRRLAMTLWTAVWAWVAVRPLVAS